MKTYQLSDEDATQVRAILLTQAEMQDQRTVANEVLRGRLSSDPEAGDPEGAELVDVIEDLSDIHEDLSQDRDNLKRIAEIFQ